MLVMDIIKNLVNVLV